MDMKKTLQFVRTPPEIIFHERLSPIDVRIYEALRSYRREDKRSTVWPARITIAERLRCSLSTVDRSIKALCSIGCISYIPGMKGRSNRYQFHDEMLYPHRINPDTISPSLALSDSVTHAGSAASSMTPQPESDNQNNKPRKRWHFRHRRDVAHVKEDGSIIIKTPMGWKLYGGGDEEGFKYGPLNGTEARRAAEIDAKMKYSLEENHGGMVSALPTNGEASEPNRSTTPPFNNSNHHE